MAKSPKINARQKASAKHGVSLTMLPWETHVKHGGKWVRTARPDLEEVDVLVDTARNGDGDVVARRARVWRTAMPPVLKALNPAGQAAMLDYAEALASVGASGGGGDFGGGGGSGGGARSPSLAKLIAAEALGNMNTALSGREVLIVRSANDPHGPGTHRASYRDVAAWVAVDGAGPREIMRRIGGPLTSPAALGRCVVSIAEISQILAVCCGYCTAPFARANVAQQ